MTDGLYYVCAVEYHMTACVFCDSEHPLGDGIQNLTDQKNRAGNGDRS